MTSRTYVEEYKSTTDVPLRKIVINNLDRRTTCTDLRCSFSAFGCVEECSIDPTLCDNPCAYITFEKEEGAIRALTENNIILNNISLGMRPATYSQQPDNLEQLLLTSDELNRIQSSPRNSYNRNDLRNDTDKPSLNELNDDCLKYIFSFLPILDKLRVEIVCKRWKGLSQEYWLTMRTLDFLPSTWGMSDRDIISITSGSFCGVLSRCGKFLRAINLKSGSNLRRGRNLAYRSIPQWFTIDTLSDIGTHCPKLKKFDTGQLLMTAKGVDTLTSACPNLTTIILRLWEDIEDVESSLLNFFQKLVKLEYFKICELIYGFTGTCLSSLPIETMHTLIIDGCLVYDIYLSEALKRLINLRDLRIMDCNDINDLTISVINNYCTNLRILKLKYLFQTPMTEFNNTKLTNLEVLSIRYNFKLTNNILLNIVRHCPMLTEINVKDCPVTEEAISYLEQHYSRFRRSSNSIPIKFRYFNINTYRSGV